MESLLQDKSDWIARKLAKWQDRPKAIAWRDGAILRYLGQEIRLALRQDARSRTIEFDGTRLHLALPDPDDDTAVQRKVAQWLARQSRPGLRPALELLSAKLAFPRRPYIFPAPGRVGEAAIHAGEIRLNWRLIQAPPHIIHYVVAHELHI